MSREEIVRAWRDPSFRASLPAEQRARLPQSPVGVVEPPDTQFAAGVAAGGAHSHYIDFEWSQCCNQH